MSHPDTEVPAEKSGADVPGLADLLAACRILMSDIGEASLRTVATQALRAYAELDDAGKARFFHVLATDYDVDPARVRAAFHRWDEVRSAGGAAGDELVQLFTVVEPARQQLLRRMNHAPGATLSLVGVRSDLRRLMHGAPQLKPLDHDFHHLLTSWFNRGFLQMAEITSDSPAQLHRHLLQYETVHPMADDAELQRRIRPADRRMYAFFHPATGDVPLIFVEVALTQGVPDRIAPLIEPGPALAESRADTAALYSINNALDGLAGVSFGSFLVKQVIEQIGRELPQLKTFVTLSPIPGFRRWLGEQARHHTALRQLVSELDALDGPAQLDRRDIERLRPRLDPALATYIAVERREDGRPADSVARFHLGNGAAAWRVNWPANGSAAAWQQSYGAMINYRYDLDLLERRHEDFVRRRAVAVDGPFARIPQPSPHQHAGKEHHRWRR